MVSSVPVSAEMILMQKWPTEPTPAVPMLSGAFFPYSIISLKLRYGCSALATRTLGLRIASASGVRSWKGS